jgi:hypothetical protein
MKFTPFDYQRRMIRHMLDNADACEFASPGLGKTVVTLTAISELILDGAARGALIVAPIRVCAITWPAQTAKWDHTNWMRVANMRTPEGQQAWEDGSADIYLINSEQLPTVVRNVKCKVCKGHDEGCDNCHMGMSEQVTPGFVDRFIKGRRTLPVDILVIDELSLAKNHASKRFNALRPYLHDIEKLDGKKNFRSPFRRRWGLTGTPAPNSYLDLFAQVRLIDGGTRLGTAFTAYQRRYFESDYMGFKWNIRPGAKETIDEKLADLALVMLGEDYLDLPTCNTEDIEVDLPAAAMKAYKTLEKELLVELETGEITALSAAALTTKLLQITAGCVFDADRSTHLVHDAKIDALRKLRKAHPKEPLLVLTAYTHERQRILEAFPEAKQFHEKDLGDWQAGKIKMWVTDYRSISHGLDGLQLGGRIAVWATPTYSWEGYTQTNARLVRTGQSYETIVYRILARGTIDSAVAEVLRMKEEGHTGLMNAIKALQLLKKSA